MPNKEPGYATMKAADINDWSFPFGKHWRNKAEIGDDLDVWAKEMRAREEKRANEILDNCEIVRAEEKAKSDSMYRSAMLLMGLGLGAGLMHLINQKK